MLPTRPPHRRAFDYYRRKGSRALLARIAQELLQRLPVLERHRHRLPDQVADALASVIFGEVDLPAEDARESSVLLRVAGWAWARQRVASIDIYVDGELLGTTAPSIHRSDVSEAFRDEPQAAMSGFSTDIPIVSLENGPHALSVVVRGGGGSTRSFERTFARISSHALYHAYYEQSLPAQDEIADLERDASAVGPLPTLSFLVDCDLDGDVAATIRSIESQVYPSVQWLIIADPSRHERLGEQLGDASVPGKVLAGLPDGFPGDGETTTLIGFLQPGEELAPGALSAFAAAAASGEGIIYSDHDIVQSSGRHIEPAFKPDWSPEHLLSRDYIGPSYVVRSGPHLGDELREIVPGRGPAWRFDLLLRLTDQGRVVRHVPRVLWSLPERRDSGGTAEDELRAVRAAIARRGYAAIADATDRPSVRRIRWELAEQPKVSIIIPTTGRIDYLRPCLDSLRACTSYDDYEVLLIDNGRGRHRDGIQYARSLGVPILTRDEPFNWAKLNNDGARETDGRLLLFLNDDIEIVQPEWLTELVSLAMRPDVGSVGSLLLYPNGMIQHAGVVLVGHGGGAMHLFNGLDPAKPLYQDLETVCREVSANTGACLMVARDRFEEVGGFDDELSVVGNDVDLCLKLLARGYRNLWTPNSTLIHHESVSRAAIAIGSDEKKMWDRWAHVLESGDAYYNPNLDRTRPDATVDWSRVKTARRPAVVEDHRWGVNLVGYIRAEMGLGEAVRGYARALHEAAIPFAIIDYSSGNPARMGDDSWLHKVSVEAPYPINLVHVNADLIGEAVAALPREMVEDRYTIGYWTWEMPEFPDEWLPAFDAVDEVWVPSTFVQDSVANKSPHPVLRVPHVVRTSPGPFLHRTDLGLSGSSYQFLTMYDVHSVRERKNPEAAVRAFKEAFEPDDLSVSLVIKVNGSDSTDGSTAEEWTDGYRNIHVMEKMLSRHEVDSLLARTDCFVSLHRSEGFGLPMAEAMGHGKPVLATYWSGNTDFMNRDTAICIQYSMVELDRDYGPYKHGQVWAEPDVDEASFWMRRLVAEPAVGRELGRAARRHVERLLAPRTIGSGIEARLRTICSEMHPTGGRVHPDS